MYLLYIDESGTSNLYRKKDEYVKDGNSRYFVLGAILIKATDLQDIEENIALIKSIYLKNENTEIKATIKPKEMKPGTKREDLITELYTTISKCSCHCFGSQVNKKHLQANNTVESKIEIYKIAFQHLLYSINRFIKQQRIKESVTVFIDGIDKNHNQILFNAYKKAILSDSEEFAGFDGRKFSPSLNFVDSQFTVGMQLADLVAGALWRGVEKDKKINSTIIKNKFPSDINSNILGYSYSLCDRWIQKNTTEKAGPQASQQGHARL